MGGWTAGRGCGEGTALEGAGLPNPDAIDRQGDHAEEPAADRRAGRERVKCGRGTRTPTILRPPDFIRTNSHTLLVRKKERAPRCAYERSKSRANPRGVEAGAQSPLIAP